MPVFGAAWFANLERFDLLTKSFSIDFGVLLWCIQMENQSDAESLTKQLAELKVTAVERESVFE